MTTALLPGSYDPFTNGHLDLVRRTRVFADRVLVAVGTNINKTYAYDTAIRIAMIRAATADLTGVDVVEMDGLLIDLALREGADLVVKGVRDGADLAWEYTQAAVNREIGDVETVFLPTRGELAHISSSVVRELAHWGLDVSRYVPGPVAALMGDN